MYIRITHFENLMGECLLCMCIYILLTHFENLMGESLLQFGTYNTKLVW